MANTKNSLELIIRPGQTTRVGTVELSLLPGVTEPIRLLMIQPDTGGNVPFRRKYRRPASCDGATEKAILILATEWYHKVQRFTVLNQARFTAIHARLDEYEFDWLSKAIETYGKSEWNRKNKVWLDIVKFFRPEKLDHWLNNAREQQIVAEHRRNAAARVNSRVHRLCGKLADGKAVQDERQELEDRFTALVDADRTRLLEQAMKELLTIRPTLRGVSPQSHQVHLQALTILKRTQP